MRHKEDSDCLSPSLAEAAGPALVHLIDRGGGGEQGVIRGIEGRGAAVTVVHGQRAGPVLQSLDTEGQDKETEEEEEEEEEDSKHKTKDTLCYIASVFYPRLLYCLNVLFLWKLHEPNPNHREREIYAAYVARYTHIR